MSWQVVRFRGKLRVLGRTRETNRQLAGTWDTRNRMMGFGKGCKVFQPMEAIVLHLRSDKANAQPSVAH